MREDSMKRHNNRYKQPSPWKRYLLIGIILLAAVIGLKNGWFDNLLTPVFQFVESSGENPNEVEPPAENENNEPADPGQQPHQDDEQNDEQEEPQDMQPEPQYLILANK